jgi:signal transduction histidine kinase
VSRSLVELMGGRIEVASTPGKGSVFTVALAAA